MNIKPFPNLAVIDLKEILVNRGDHVTHGDLIIIKCEKKDLPENFETLKDCPQGVLALGEFTGHAHQLQYEPTTTKKKTSKANLEVVSSEKQSPLEKRVTAKMVSPLEMYLVVTEPVLLKHQEHKFFRIYPGNYEIGIQVERNPYDDQIRALKD